MATEKWIAGSGVGFSWTTAVAAADLNALASGNSVLSSSGDVTNQTALDIFADISINFASVTTLSPNFMGVYLFPLNQDGTTYGDGQFSAGTGSSSVPKSQYYKGSIEVPVGTQAVVGTLTGIIIPPGTFRWLLRNQIGVATTASAVNNTCKYRTYNRSVA